MDWIGLDDMNMFGWIRNTFECLLIELTQLSMNENNWLDYHLLGALDFALAVNVFAVLFCDGTSRYSVPENLTTG